jgi:hypothetical protein
MDSNIAVGLTAGYPEHFLARDVKICVVRKEERGVGGEGALYRVWREKWLGYMVTRSVKALTPRYGGALRAACALREDGGRGLAEAAPGVTSVR